MTRGALSPWGAIFRTSLSANSSRNSPSFFSHVPDAAGLSFASSADSNGPAATTTSAPVHTKADLIHEHNMTTLLERHGDRANRNKLASARLFVNRAFLLLH